MRREVRVGVALGAAAVVLLVPRGPAQTQGAEACGPYALDFAFVRVASPDDPAGYLEGRLGVVTPTFRLPWLVSAYRHLSNQPLSVGERTALWAPEAAAGVPFAPGTVFGPQRWLRVSREVLKEPEQYRYVDQSAETPSGAYYENCPDDAFEHAAATLQARAGSLGAGDPTIRPWIEAQEQVWANCARKRGTAPRIPAALDASATPLARADRAYQIAAAHFYAGEWEAAVERFRAIAADRTSPWRPYGEYLAGRAFLRKGMIGGADGAVDSAALDEAVAAFDRVAADAASPLKTSAAGLKRFADLRRRPDAMRADVLDRLLSPSAGATFEEDLAEYRYLFLRDEPDAEKGAIRAAADPLTDWIDTLRSGSPEALGHAITRWRERGQLAWLVAAMLRVPPGHADEAALVAAARGVPASSPAWPTMAFHRARLLVRGNQLDAARTLAGEMRRASAAWPASATNQLRALELRLATTAEAFFAAALHAPVGFASDYNEDIATLGTSERLGVSADALDMLNERLPLSRLIDAAQVQAWPVPLRRNALAAVFTRALLLDDVATLTRVDPEVRAAWPALGPDVDALATAASPEERRFLVTRLLLRHPGLRPFMTGGVRRTEIDWSKTPPAETPDDLTALDGLRDNWWCALSPSPTASGTMTSYQPYQPGIYGRSGERLDPATASLYEDPSLVPWPAFLTAEEKARVEREWKALDDIGGAPDYLGREVLRWAAATRPTHGSRRRSTAWCGPRGSAARPMAAGTSPARRSPCCTSAFRRASGRRRRPTGSADAARTIPG